MSTVTLPNIRVSSDLTVGVVLKDGGVAIDWSTLSNIKAYLYADAQRAMAGRCTVSIDETDSTRLVCAYRANKPQYIGVNRIVITCTYRGETKTYDKPALNFVRWTDDQAGQQITIDDPDVDVEIEVEDVSSSLLDQAIAAALAAAAAAEHAAHLIPNQVLLDAEAATAAANAAADAANAAGITSAQVSIADDEPGTPSAEVSLVNKVLSIIFYHLKGNTGDAAGFGTITATVDDVVGDPSVTVTATGPDTAKNFAFAFHGLRGIQGVPGVANAKYKQVDSLPTASAATMDFIYLTPSGTTGVYNMSYTEQDGSTYSWQDLGTTAIQLSDYATKAEVSQLEAKVDYLSTGKYYGYFAQEEDLPEADVDGFAYVGEGPNYTIYNLRGGVWTSSEITVNQSPIGNDEDIDQNEDGKLQFANRTYNSLQPNGMGYKILRKGAAFASQVTETNTIYEIRYPFNLGGNEFSMPSGCVLRFVGGSISNGTITTNPFRVVADNDVSILKGIAFDGSYITNETIFVDWFDFVTDGVTDNLASFRRLDELVNNKGGGNVVFGNGKTYAVKLEVNYATNVYWQRKHCAMWFNGCDNLDINLNGSTIKELSTNTPIGSVFGFVNTNGRIHDGKIRGDRDTHDYSSYTDYGGNPSTNFEWNVLLLHIGGNPEISNLDVSYSCGDGIVAGSGSISNSLSFDGNYSILGCKISHCGRNGITGHSAIGINKIADCYIHHIGAYNNLPGYNPQAGIDFEFEDGLGNKPYMSVENCVFEDCSRRGISVALNTIFLGFLVNDCTFRNSSLLLSNLSYSQDYCTPEMNGCYIEDNDDSTQLEYPHYLGTMRIVDCKFVGLRRINVHPKEFRNCYIETTGTKQATESVFPEGSSNVFPETIGTTIKVNSGFIQFANQQELRDSNIIIADSAGSPRMASVVFTSCRFTVGQKSRNNTNLGTGDVVFNDCDIEWTGTGNDTIAGYSAQQNVYFNGCRLKNTRMVPRAGTIRINNSVMEGCGIWNTSGGTTDESYVNNSFLHNCKSHSSKGTKYSNCHIIQDSTDNKAFLTGIGGTSTGQQYDEFDGCKIFARNFTGNTGKTYSTYYNCHLDIANCQLNGAKLYGCVVVSTTANQSAEFISSLFLLNGVESPAKIGTTANRPTATVVGAGFTYFDTDLGKMIVSNGTAWVNMDGTALSS